MAYWGLRQVILQLITLSPMGKLKGGIDNSRILFVAGLKLSWFWQLLCVLLGLRNSQNYETDISPAQLVYIENIDIPGLMVRSRPDEQDVTTFATELSKAIENQKFVRNFWHGGENRAS